MRALALAARCNGYGPVWNLDCAIRKKRKLSKRSIRMPGLLVSIDTEEKRARWLDSGHLEAPVLHNELNRLLQQSTKCALALDQRGFLRTASTQLAEEAVVLSMIECHAAQRVRRDSLDR
jgi:hypothetical protein